MLNRYRCAYWNMPTARDWPLFPFWQEEAEVEGTRISGRMSADYLICAAVRSGEIAYRAGDREYRLERGMILLIPPGLPYSFRSSTGYVKNVLELKGTHLSSMLTTLGLGRAHLLKTEKFEEIVGEMEEIGRLLERRDGEDIPLLMGKTYALLHRFALLAAAERSGEEQLLSAALSLLESRLGEAVSMAEFARRLAVGERTLERLVRKHLGATPRQYRNRCRIGRAKYLLLGTELSVKEIAFRLGYCNPFYFSAEFRRETGYSPQAYRRDFFSRYSVPDIPDPAALPGG